MTRKRLLVLASLTAMLSTGCALHSAYVTARHDESYSLAGAKTLIIAAHDKPVPEEEGLNRSLKAVLEQSEFHVVSDAHADYTIAYWVEDNWHENRQAPEVTSPASREYGYDYMRSVGGRGTSQNSDPLAEFKAMSRANRIQNPYTKTRGIRLKLYRTAELQAGHFKTIWEGFIDAGEEVPAERQQQLLKTLLQYLGRDYSGRVKFVE